MLGRTLARSMDAGTSSLPRSSSSTGWGWLCDRMATLALFAPIGALGNAAASSWPPPRGSPHPSVQDRGGDDGVSHTCVFNIHGESCWLREKRRTGMLTSAAATGPRAQALSRTPAACAQPARARCRSAVRTDASTRCRPVRRLPALRARHLGRGGDPGRAHATHDRGQSRPDRVGGVSHAAHSDPPRRWLAAPATPMLRPGGAARVSLRPPGRAATARRQMAPPSTRTTAPVT